MLPSKILLKRGPGDTIPDLDVGEPAFTTDTHNLYVGFDGGNVNVANSVQTLGFVVDDCSDQIVSGGETSFALTGLAGSILVTIDGLLQLPSLVSIGVDGASVDIPAGVPLGSELIIIRAAALEA